MEVIRGIPEMQDYASKIRNACAKQGDTIGFVPTMGYFHEGHASLIKAGAGENKKTIVSIFVNPIQFGPEEDFEKYPRDEKKDIKTLKDTGIVDCVFIPSAEEMYNEGHNTYVEVAGNMTKALCGAARPGHFKGVATVVAKLLNIVRPDRLYLGQKDIQQAVVLNKMARELNYPVKTVTCPIVREKDGLAMSSRNAYLSPDERNSAPVLYKALQIAESMAELGERNSRPVIKEMKRKIKEETAEIEYIEAVDADTLEKKERLEGKVIIAAAIRIGRVRLIDNIILDPKQQGGI